MELSKQVTSLELSKKLQELGVKKNIEINDNNLCHFVYCVEDGCCDNELHLIHHDNDEGCDTGNNYSHRVGEFSFIKAYTPSDLGKILPHALEKTATWLVIRGTWKQGWFVEYVPDDGEPNATHHKPDTQSDNLADAMAKMLIYLLQNNLIKQ